MEATMTRETRAQSVPAEVRAEADGIRVSGYAAVFGQVTDIGGYFREVIEAGAFSESLKRGDDVVFVINHEGLPLARTVSGTLTLSEDDHGLRMETFLRSDDPDVMRIIPKMERGDLNKMSFAFLPDVQEWDETQDPPLRTIRKASLFDVSIVTTPAYGGTDIGLRSLDAARKSKKTHNFEATARRMRMKLNLAAKAQENG
jgi:hypothetical protein